MKEDNSYKKDDSIYKNVPGRGQKLPDGTRWTNSNKEVGEICQLPYYYRKVVNGKYYASDKREKCVETILVDGKHFARWEDLRPTEFKPCIYYTNHSLKYE